MTSVDFPEPDTPVTATSRPRGNSTSTSCRLCSRAPSTVSTSPLPGRRTAGTGIDLAPERYWPVSESGLDSSPPGPVTGPEWTMRPPCSPAPGPDVDHVVGDPDGLLVVLDHDDRVAQVAEALRACRSAAGCRAGGGRWTARPGRRGPRPARCRSGWPAGCAGPRRPTGWPPSGPGSGSRAPRRAGTASARGPRGRPGRRSGGPGRTGRATATTSTALPMDSEHRAKMRVAADGDGQRLGPQPGPAALGAGHLAQVALEVVPQEVRLGLGVAPLQPGDDALVEGVERPLAPVAVAVLEVDLLGCRPRRGPASGPPCAASPRGRRARTRPGRPRRPSSG